MTRIRFIIFLCHLISSLMKGRKNEEKSIKLLFARKLVISFANCGQWPQFDAYSRQRKKLFRMLRRICFYVYCRHYIRYYLLLNYSQIYPCLSEFFSYLWCQRYFDVVGIDFSFSSVTCVRNSFKMKYRLFFCTSENFLGSRICSCMPTCLSQIMDSDSKAIMGLSLHRKFFFHMVRLA